jgi:hypothetical protein
MPQTDGLARDAKLARRKKNRESAKFLKLGWFYIESRKRVGFEHRATANLVCGRKMFVPELDKEARPIPSTLKRPDGLST